MSITWPTIGGQEVIGINGTIVRPTRRSDMLLRPGLDGVTVRLGEKRGELFEISAPVDATAANLQVKLAAFRDMSATVITIVERFDGSPVTHDDVWAFDVKLSHRPVALSAGGVEDGAGVHRILVEMTCIVLATN